MTADAHLPSLACTIAFLTLLAIVIVGGIVDRALRNAPPHQGWLSSGDERCGTPDEGGDRP